LTHNNQYKEVYRTMKKEINEYFKIKISGSETILVSEEHPFLARKKYIKYIKINGKKLLMF